MSEVYDGGPAFPPSGTPHPTDPMRVASGISLRDWFAFNASDCDINSIESDVFDPDKKEWVHRSRAVRRYIFADLMLAAREGRP